MWLWILVFAYASGQKVSFVTTADEHGLAPGLVALLRCKEFYREAALFVAMDSKHRSSSTLQEHLGSYRGLVEPLYVDVVTAMSDKTLAKLRNCSHIYPISHRELLTNAEHTNKH